MGILQQLQHHCLLNLLCVYFYLQKERKTCSLNAHNDGVKTLFYMLFLTITDTDSFCLTQTQNYTPGKVDHLYFSVFGFLCPCCLLSRWRHHWLACGWTSAETCSFLFPRPLRSLISTEFNSRVSMHIHLQEKARGKRWGLHAEACNKNSSLGVNSRPLILH